MKLSKLAAKPQLIQMTLNDEDLVKEYGEPIEFYTWDRQPLDVFMKMANANQQDAGQMIDIVKTLILDEKGKPVIDNETMLPTNVLVRVIAKVVESLGN